MYNKTKNMNNEYLHMQKLAGLITEGEYQAKMNESSQDTKINFGPFKNVTSTPRGNEIYLTVTESDNFIKIEDSLEYETDELTDEQKSFLNNEVYKLAQDMSDYLASINIQNDIYDNPIGYGQEIDNLVVAFDKEDISKLK